MLSGNKEKYLLDTSALFALIEDEKGADEVERILRQKKIILPFIVLLKVYYISFRERGEEIADKRYAMLKSLDAEFLWGMDEPILITAGKFKGKYKLPLEDAIIAAYARNNQAILVHKDREYEVLRDQVRQYILPYEK